MPEQPNPAFPDGGETWKRNEKSVTRTIDLVVYGDDKVTGREFTEELALLVQQSIKDYREWLIGATSDDVAGRHYIPHCFQPQTSWLGRWGFLAYLLSRKARQEVFEPAWHELLEDYAVARARYCATWQRRSLNAIFAWRAVCLVWQCVRAVVGDRVIRLLERLAPQLVRWWLTR